MKSTPIIFILDKPPDNIITDIVKKMCPYNIRFYISDNLEKIYQRMLRIEMPVKSIIILNLDRCDLSENLDHTLFLIRKLTPKSDIIAIISHEYLEKIDYFFEIGISDVLFQSIYFSKIQTAIFKRLNDAFEFYASMYRWNASFLDPEQIAQMERFIQNFYEELARLPQQYNLEKKFLRLEFNKYFGLDKKRKVLVVDDDDSMRKIMMLELIEIYSVFSAKNEEEALNVVHNEPDIDVAILDVRIPRYGDELIKKIKEIQSKIEVIVNTDDYAKFNNYNGIFFSCGQKPNLYILDTMKNVVRIKDKKSNSNFFSPTAKNLIFKNLLIIKRFLKEELNYGDLCLYFSYFKDLEIDKNTPLPLDAYENFDLFLNDCKENWKKIWCVF